MTADGKALNLVTGATGIVGAHVLLKLLQLGRRVRALRRSGSRLDEVSGLFRCHGAAALLDAVEWVEGDVTDIFSVEDALAGVSVVFHCAGLVSFDDRDAAELSAVNEAGTRNVVNACLALRDVSLCHVSSIGAISNPDHDVITEDVFWKATGLETAYARSKYNGEREVWRGIEEGLQAVIVNPGVVISASFTRRSSGALFAQARKGIRFGTPGVSGYVAAMDLAAVMVTLVDERHFGNRYIVVENNYSFAELAQMLNLKFGKRVRLHTVSPRQLRWAARLEALYAALTGARKRLSKGLVKAAFGRQKYSNAKVIGATGFRFTPLREAIDASCA